MKRSIRDPALSFLSQVVRTASEERALLQTLLASSEKRRILCEEMANSSAAEARKFEVCSYLDIHIDRPNVVPVFERL